MNRVPLARWMGRCLVVALPVVVVAIGMAAGCSGGPEMPADAVAAFDGGWVTAAEVSAAAEGRGARPSELASRRGGNRDEVARWIAWEKLAARERRGDVVGRRDWQLRTRELECERLIPRLLAELESAVELSDEAVEAEIESVRTSLEAKGPRLEIRHIFLRASDDVPPEERARKLALAERLHDELQRGADIAALARQYSESSTAPNGGLVAGLRPGMADPAFERVVFELAEGEISGVIETRSGFHIARLERRSGPEPIDEEELREQLPEQLRRRKADQARSELLARLKQSEPHEARWNEASRILDPRPKDGALLVVGEFVFSAEDLRVARAQAGVALQRRDQIQAFLDGLLERELLAAEAARRFQPSRKERAAARERAAEAALIELAVRDEEAELQATVPRAELERFAAEHPDQLEVAATYRPQVIFLADGKNAWESFREAEQMVAQLRAGADFAAAARERSAGPNADLGGDLGLLTTNQMMAYDIELLRTVVELELGEVSDPVRVPEAKLSNQPGSMEGGFLIVTLVERREPHTLDLEADEAEIRRRFWVGHRAEILRQRRDERLLVAEFKLREAPTGAPANAPVADPQS